MEKDDLPGRVGELNRKMRVRGKEEVFSLRTQMGRYGLNNRAGKDLSPLMDIVRFMVWLDGFEEAVEVLLYG